MIWGETKAKTKYPGHCILCRDDNGEKTYFTTTHWDKRDICPECRHRLAKNEKKEVKDKEVKGYCPGKE